MEWAINLYISIGGRASFVVRLIIMGVMMVAAINLLALGVVGRGWEPRPILLLGSLLLFASAAGYIAWQIYQHHSVIVSNTQHGSAGFTKPRFERDLQFPSEGFLPPGALFISPGKNDVVLPRELTILNAMIVGGTGTGKTRAFFLPTAAWSRATSLICTDPKGELWKYTSAFHKRPRRYAPRDPDHSNCFNWIPLCAETAVAIKFARAIMQQDDDSHAKEQRFFKVGDRNFCAALFQYTATLPEPTPATAYRLLSLDVFDLLRLFEKSDAAVAQRCAADMLPYENGDNKVVAGIKMSVSQQLAFLDDPAIQRFTSAKKTAPDFSELRRWPVAVYYVLSEQDLAELQPLSSLFYTCLLHQLTQGSEEGDTTVPITMLLDEFGNLGKIPDFVKTISVTRYRNIALVLGLQSLHQLDDLYGPNGAKTIRTNCATKIGMHGMDVDNAEYFSRMLGETTIVTTQHSNSSQGIGQGSRTTTTKVRNQRRLMTADEVIRLGKTEMVFRASNRRPMKLKKLYYDAAPVAAQTQPLPAARSCMPEVLPRPTRKKKDLPPDLPM